MKKSMKWYEKKAKYLAFLEKANVSRKKWLMVNVILNSAEFRIGRLW